MSAPLLRRIGTYTLTLTPEAKGYAWEWYCVMRRATVSTGWAQGTRAEAIDEALASLELAKVRWAASRAEVRS